MDNLLSFVEKHPVLVTICLFFLSTIGFLVKRKFFSEKETVRNANFPHIQAGGSISASGDIVVGAKIINAPAQQVEVNNQTREDLLYFFEQWLQSELDLFDFMNKNWNAFEEKIGKYRCEKLFGPLKEMKICGFKRGYNDNLLIAPYRKAYDKTYIESIMRGIQAGYQDKYL